MAIDEMLDVILSDEWEAGGTGAATGTNAGRRSTRKHTAVVRDAHASLSEDTSSDDGDSCAKRVTSGWLVRLHQMLTLRKDHIIEYDGRLVIRDQNLLASEVRYTAAPHWWWVGRPGRSGTLDAERAVRRLPAGSGGGGQNTRL